MLKKISASELKVGMYVDSIIQKSSTLKISQQGFISSDSILKKLKDSGVVYAIIDTDKSQNESEPDKPESIKEEAPKRTRKSSASLSGRLKAASKLYEEARTLQAQALSNIKEGKKLNVEPLNHMAEALIDSIFDDQDTLLCVSQMRNKDSYLLEHSINVSILMTVFANHLKYPRTIIQQLAVGGLLHDIGKIKVPDSILNKPGRLTQEEFEEMKRHVEYGIAEVQDIADISDISMQVIAMHHEKLDGSGYPKGLKGNEITPFGRIASIVDIFDALTGERSYKKGIVHVRALKMLMEQKELLDMGMVEQFIKCIGVHPVGSIVLLKSGKLGIVTRSNPDSPLKPLVKTFYSAKHRHFLEIKEVDLASKFCEDEIEKSVKAEEFGINFQHFFNEQFVA
ncbi:HD-GYP domain-containing protein [Pleionea sp. CnH1-48]|uniref:HD-GYP domain-containing protein n=1 Tax=Pleionea sp. CnH1-48 TaxID=2954494 RepID=UPI002097559C|nr:HD-GYP domain-containing protein [Pleionea sp. CnH1-48]MCO7227177.1 HD-GYP domain-containing protein [Pleionea sp. CnH1-48]